MSELDEYKKLIRQQQAEIADLKEQNAYLKRMIFASRSEKVDPNQTSLFEEDNGVFTEPERTGEKSKASTTQVQSKKAKKTRKEQVDSNVPVRTTVIEPTDNKCPEGHDGIVSVGKKFLREELCIIPARMYLNRIYVHTYKCAKCEEESAVSRLFQSITPPALIPHSLASASLVEEILYRKFVLGVPLYRQLPELNRLGYHTSEATLTSWVIKTAQLISPLYQELHQQLCQVHHLQGDETPLEVLREPGKAPTSKSYMWVARTPIKVPNPIVYYAYSATRSGKFAQRLYQNYQGALQCDGYSGYNLLGDDIQRMGCWAHVRRKFYDVFKSHIKGAARPLQLINDMFDLEKEWQKFSPRVRRRRRRSRLRKILKRFWRELNYTEALPQSRLGKAIDYARSQRVTLDRIINDGVIDWSNNASERNMKAFVIGRKNWLFSTSTKGADSTAIWMTIIESAKANHIDPRKYLTDLLTDFPKLPAFPKKEDLTAYLPWNYRRNINKKEQASMPRQEAYAA